jgi:hypothetical protein
MNRIERRLGVLEDILVERLPLLSRWKKVEVYGPEEDWPPLVYQSLKASFEHEGKSFVDNKKKSFLIYWNGAKSKGNSNEYEHKMVPLDEMEKEIAKHRTRMRNETADKYK